MGITDGKNGNSLNNYGLRLPLITIFGTIFIFSCNEPEVITEQEVVNIETESEGGSDDFRPDEDILSEVFGDRLSLDYLWNYENQAIPNYINEDNTEGNEIQDEIATLGRVLFYDKSLSSDNSISCASCHIQTAGFGDTEVVSQGVNGITGRHSMRLINARFGEEQRFFWDERADELELQTTIPIRDHIEMGFSGGQGDEDFNDLLEKLDSQEYLPILFEQAYGDSGISEERIQLALAQFIRSIQSFDSKFDAGRATTDDDDEDFSNFSAVENLGKRLFMGRAGCDRCHQAPEFSINDNSDNNGVISVAGDPEGIDNDVTKAPTLRDVFNSEGQLNGPMMHDGSFSTFEEVLAHYNDIEIDLNNDNLDNRLIGRGGRNGTRNTDGQNLNLSEQEVDAIIAFVKTLSGTNVYTDERWSNPFVEE